MEMDALSQIASWCNIHDPKHVRDARIDSPTLMSFLETADSFHGISRPVVSHCTVVGNQAQQTLDRDNKIRSAISNHGKQISLEQVTNLLRSHPAAGCTTVMDMARISSGFNPLIPLESGNFQAYISYIKLLVTLPLFELEDDCTKTFSQQAADWNNVKKDIVNLYERISETDQQLINQSWIRLVNAATSHANTRQSENLLVQNILELTNEIHVYIQYSSVTFEFVDTAVSSGKSVKHYYSQNYDLALHRIKLRFKIEFWPDSVELVVSKHRELVNDWLDGNTTKPGDDPLHSLPCIETSFIHAPEGNLSKSHKDAILKFKTWDGSNWSAKLRGDMFLLAPEGDSSNYQPGTTLNYKTWDGSNWTARVGLLGVGFLLAPEGDFTKSRLGNVLKYKNWDNANWTAKIPLSKVL